jgi:predicted Ser/Thr protein kinase
VIPASPAPGPVRCFRPMGDSSLPTETGPSQIRRRSDAPARFLPGQILAGRYRIVAPLGRGGMGEVYRADDMKLGQPVALKFLPPSLTEDEDRRRRLLDEVRLARQVAHPHVCRVWDVGEVDGQDFLAMEYVDGEDLASLLRRVGRLPEDRAVRMARELCAGLAAAHDQGILHRDLKPANVMVDGRGRVKLADFGLASAMEDVGSLDARSGTPAYLSPEQVEGREVTARSDVYALGLVLYELFTGQVACPAKTLAEAAQRGETPPPRVSRHVEGLDPAIERAIERCLEPDPARRPATATEVAAALPGGDPLAAALAAGETPSPEIVAAAGPEGALRPGVALAGLAAVVLLWFANLLPGRSINPFDHLPLVKSFAALEDDAREVVQRLGYDETVADTWAGYGFDFAEYLHLVQEHGPASLADDLSQPGQPVLLLGYRQDDGPLTPVALNGRVTWSSPAPSPGDIAVSVDLGGRLHGLRVTPWWPDAGEEAAEVDWGLLFELAGLDIEQFETVPPTTRPPSFADTRRAWTGTLPDYGDRPVRIEAAALDGRPIAFSTILSSDPRWKGAGGQPPRVATGVFGAAEVILLLVLAVTLVGAAFLALRNLRLGRGDRKGAYRLSAFVFAMRMLHWALAGDHVAHLDLLRPLAVAFSGATALALLTWIAYVACEPYVRRLWPQALVSWTRVLAGRLRDPLVGRDLLVGFTFASVQGLILVWALWAAERAGLAGLIPLEDSLIVVRGGRFAVGELFRLALVSTTVALAFTMVFLLLKMLCRKTWIAGTVLCLVWGVVQALPLAGLWGPAAGLFILVPLVVVSALYVVVLVRFGLLASIAAFFLGGLSQLAVVTLDPSSPLFGIGLFVTAVTLGLATWAAFVSLGGRPWMADSLLEA